jgi:hypothetical protein
MKSTTRDFERFRYSADERSRITAACAPTADTDHVIWLLEAAWINYAMEKATDYSDDKRGRISRVLDRLRELGDEMEKLHGSLDDKEPRDPNDAVEDFLDRLAIDLKKSWAMYEGQLAQEFARTSRIIASRSGDTDPHLEILYSQVLVTWTQNAGGKLVANPSRSKTGARTGGPQARFFTAALTPVLKDDFPKSLHHIFERECERRSGLREQVWFSPYAPS